jgi:glycosyltransferase involved in cell wall biosynthesis
VRVLHILNSTKGGATVSIVELVKTSRAAETGVQHFAAYPGRPGFVDPAIHSAFHEARPIPLPGWNQPKSLDFLRRSVIAALVARNTGFGTRTNRALGEAIREWQPDLVTTNCAANVHGALAARRAGLPHVWHIRERIGTGGSMHFPLSDGRLVQHVGELSTAVATVSEYVAEPFRRHGVDSELEVVFDGVDLDAFVAPAAIERGWQLRRKWGIPKESMLVAKVANLTAQVKRHDVFLRAAAQVARRHPDVRFVVVGAIPKGNGWLSRSAIEHWNRLESLARDLGLGGSLVWADSVDDPPAIMNAIDVLAHACDIEGFPRVVIEAMAAGKPVVGPRAGGVAEGVGDEGGLLVEPGSPEHLAEGIEALIEDQELSRRLGTNGRRRVVDNFSSKHHLNKMVDLYETACKWNSQTAVGAVCL